MHPSSVVEVKCGGSRGMSNPINKTRAAAPPFPIVHYCACPLLIHLRRPSSAWGPSHRNRTECCHRCCKVPALSRQGGLASIVAGGHHHSRSSSGSWGQGAKDLLQAAGRDGDGARGRQVPIYIHSFHNLDDGP